VHLKAEDGTPMANVMLSAMHKLGMDDVKTFGDSSGVVRALGIGKNRGER
jgi:hypothetical protein